MVMLICLAFFLSSCGYEESNKKPNDDISKIIGEAVGESAFYLGNTTYGEEKEAYIVYDYLIKDYDDEDLFSRVVMTANEVAKAIENEKVCLKIILWEEIPGGREAAVVISNFENRDDSFIWYPRFQYLKILGNRHSLYGEQSRYNKATTYISAENIKSLVVTDKIAENAKAEGVDWYEIWPDLEYYEVYTR